MFAEEVDGRQLEGCVTSTALADLDCLGPGKRGILPGGDGLLLEFEGFRLLRYLGHPLLRLFHCFRIFGYLNVVNIKGVVISLMTASFVATSTQKKSSLPLNSVSVTS